MSELQHSAICAVKDQRSWSDETPRPGPSTGVIAAAPTSLLNSLLFMATSLLAENEPGHNGETPLFGHPRRRGVNVKVGPQRQG